MKITLRQVLAIVLVATTASAGTAYAAALLFTHTVPSVTVTAPAMSTTCAGTTLTASTTSITSGTSGSITLQCPGPVAVFTSTGGPDTPSFTLPAGYTSLTITAFSNTNLPCTAGTALTSGTPIAIAPGSYEYCLIYTNPSSAIPSFTVSWS